MSDSHVSHSNRASALADILKDNQDKIQQIINDREAGNGTADPCNEMVSDDPTPKRLSRHFSEAAQLEDSGVTITDYDKPASP